MLTEHRGHLVIGSLLVATATVLGSVVYWRFGSPFLAGFFAGTLLTAFVAVVLWAAELASRTKNARFGTYGEEMTEDLFRRRRSRRDGWQVVHNIPFGRRDVDHVAFGPRGVLVVESKWANHPWRVGGDRLDVYGDDPIGQVARNARTIRCLLRGAGARVEVTPVVIQWGPGGLRDESWSWRTFDCGVTVVRGRHAPEWLDGLACTPGPPLDPELLSTIRDALEQRKREHVEPAR